MYACIRQVTLSLPMLLSSNGNGAVRLVPSTFGVGEQARFCLYVYASDPIDLSTLGEGTCAASGVCNK